MYATASDLIRRFSATDLVHLTNERDAEVPAELLEAAAADDGLGGYTDAQQAAAAACLAAIDEAAEDAQSEIDPYLIAGGYDAPLGGAEGEGGVPRAIERVASHIAHYNLHERPTESVRGRYEDAVSFLKRVGRGQASLGPTESGEDGPAPTDGGVDFSGSEPTFSGERRPGGSARYPGPGGLYFFRRLTRGVVGL